MEKYYKILFYLNQYHFHGQRDLAKGTDLSVGLVNATLKNLEKEGYLKKQMERIESKQYTYKITDKGQKFMEEVMQGNHEKKLVLSKSNRSIKTAVILAAGASEAFPEPVGLLKIHDLPVVEHIIRALMNNGIEKIYMVIGYEHQKYKAWFEKRNITLIYNERYKWTGSMYSFAQVKDIVKEDFLLVDVNQIFEETAITKLLESEAPDCVLLVSPSGSEDEAYVELNEDGSIFRVSKDMRQLNRVDAEMVGLSKISYSLLKKMLDYFKNNQNPMLNYEYVIENVGRIYQIQGIVADDLSWTVIENQELYHKAAEIIYPKIKKKAQLRKENTAKETLKACMNLKDEDIGDFGIVGGMTNTNFYVKMKGKEYVLRMPGACTDIMINRKSEQHNSALASSIGINPITIYFNGDTGVKITEFIANAETLNGKTARLEMNIKETTQILKTLHNSDLKLYNDFSVQQEYEKYKKMIQENNGTYYEKFDEMDQFFYFMMDRLQTIGLHRKPCHNDLVAENFIKNGNGKMYLIDWEYSGYNDPMWDLAAHLIECEFLPVEEELFLNYYFEGKVDTDSQEKILIFKICQGILWSAWTILKEIKGEDFGSYGSDRLRRAMELREEYRIRYENK